MKIIPTVQRELWHSFLKWMPADMQDIHYWPEMMFPYEVTGRGRGGLLIDEKTGCMLMPLLKVDNHEFHHPFNFGGPIATPEYAGEMAINGPVYCTLNPFFTPRQQQLVPVSEYQKETIWVDLTKDFKFRQTTRHAIAKAEKGNAEFNIVNWERFIDIFTDMYNQTMDRTQAADHWYFDVDWFRSFMSNLDSHAVLGMVTIEGEPEGGCILLHGYGTCYYHFAASYRNHPNLGTNHLMVAKALEHAKDVLKCKRFHLGGGVQRRDGLFTFKSGFSDLTLPVYKYRPELLEEVRSCHGPSQSSPKRA